MSREKSGWRQWWAEFSDFWDLPASENPDHHHGETHGEHAFEVYYLAKKHFRRHPDPTIRKNRSIRRSFLRAALFHDVGKFIDRSRHDLAGCYWMIGRDLLAAHLILRHMGRWGHPEVDGISSTFPFSLYHYQPWAHWLFETLQACDYTAACCLSGGI